MSTLTDTLATPWLNPDQTLPCQGHDFLFFPETDWRKRGRYLGPDAQEARRICAECPIRASCLAHALEYEEHGIWGGTDPRERQQMRGGRRGRSFTNPLRFVDLTEEEDSA